MSKVGVSLKIDVSKIDKQRWFSGQKGTYLDATVCIDLDQLDQYGNSGMITQDVSKQEKDNGVKGNILGNCKVFWSEQGQAPQQQCYQQAPQQGFQQQQRPMDAAMAQNGINNNQGQQQAPHFEPNQDIPFAPVGLPFNNNALFVIS